MKQPIWIGCFGDAFTNQRPAREAGSERGHAERGLAFCRPVQAPPSALV